MKSETIQAADGIRLSTPIYELPGLLNNQHKVSGMLSVAADPADLGVRRLGHFCHFGPFRSEHEAQLWPRMAQWFSGLSLPKAA